MAETSGSPRIVRRVGTAALVLAALAVGGAISSKLRADPDDQHRPFLSSGTSDQTIHTRSFDTRFVGVRGGSAIGSGGVRHDSNGVWVIVKLRLTANHEATRIMYAALRDGDDRTFTASERVTQNALGGRNLQPGIPVDVEFAFEVPIDVPLNLAVRLATNITDHRMDGMAEIGLPISREDLTKWKEDKDPLAIARPVLAGASTSPSASPRPTPSSATATPSVTSSSRTTTSPRVTTSPKATSSPRSTVSPSVRSSS